MSKFVCFLAACVLTAFPAASSDRSEAISFDVRLNGGALICDKADSVVLYLKTGMSPSDCGILRTPKGSPVTVTIIGDYEGKPLAMFHFHTQTPWENQTQYGWWADDFPTPKPQGVAL